jgi:DNA-binding response OmpR family regulator
MKRVSTRILVIEDEKDIVRLLKYNLEKEGYVTLTAHDGEAGLDLARKDKPDLILLDLMLPKMDGMQVCRAIRQDSQVPIIMLTAKKEEIDRIVGLELGADDYVTKPFSVRELLARIKTILRRTRPEAKEDRVFKAGSLETDFSRYTVTVKGKPVALSSKEFDFLKILIQANGKALTRDQLLEQVWGHDPSFEIDTRTIDQHIARLRDKLGPESKRVITVKNVGYRFDTA